nr:calcineurin B-like protein 4 [Tanacetum cinerariifolium]
MLTKEIGRSSRIDDEVVQDQRQRDDNDHQDERQDQPKEEEVEPRRSKSARIEKSFGPNFVSFMLVDLLSGCKPLGYKWIFKKKMNADGTIDKYKARLIIKGFRQHEGLGYFDTYWPVTRITPIRKGKILIKVQDNAFNGAIREKVFEHINKFLEVIRPIKINEVSQDRFRLSVFPISLAGVAGQWLKKDCIGLVTTWDDLVEKFIQKFYQLSDHNEEIKEYNDPKNIADIFMIVGSLFDFETPLCEAFNNFNYLLKIDKDLFTIGIQETGTYEEYELNNPVTRDHKEPWLNNGCHISYVITYVNHIASRME